MSCAPQGDARQTINLFNLLEAHTTNDIIPGCISAVKFIISIYMILII
jgi:hypothetical protein